MTHTNNIVEMDSARLKNLEEKIIILAKNVQDGKIEDPEVYALIDQLMSNRLLTRDLFVKTLEQYNDSLSGTTKDNDTGLDTTTRFRLIDAYDFIIRIKEQQAINESLVDEIIS